MLDRHLLGLSLLVAPVLPTERIAHTAVGQERVALQNFSPVYVRFGSFTTEAGKAKGRSTSASPQKRTSGQTCR
jgi:hypothetical protein